MISVYMTSVPFDNSYSHVVDFEGYSKDNQLNYFLNLYGMRFESDTLCDAFRNSIVVPYAINVCGSFDYIILTDYNNPTGPKSFFYFILERKMKTRGTTELILELDVYQTYYFDYIIRDSFVERCHVPRWDTFGKPTDNNLDEGLEYGPTRVSMIEKVADIEDKYIICATTPIGKLEEGGGSSEGSGGGGSPSEGIGSNNLIRYMKGWEGYASQPYNDSGGVLTAGYGVTKINEPTYWSKLEPFPCSEKTATIVLIELLKNNYGKPLADKMEKDGIDITSLPSNKFDAFLDLCYNAGFTGCTTSPMYKRFVDNPSDPNITDGWENYYVHDNAGNLLQGLVNRRKDEVKMFNNNVYNFRAIQDLTNGGYVEGGGYMPSTDGELIGDALVNSAKKLVGKPYVWGGNYPPLGNDRGTDCSGLMQWAFNDNKRKISRTTYTQIKEGKEINQQDVKKGDLIFSNFTAVDTPQHVYMYAGMENGKHMCVEAPRTGLNIRVRSFEFTTGMRVRRLY